MSRRFANIIFTLSNQVSVIVIWAKWENIGIDVPHDRGYLTLFDFKY